MSVARILNKETIQLNNECSLLIEGKQEDGYEWKELILKSAESETYVGSYFTHNYSCSREWMRYNSKYIAILVAYSLGYEHADPSIKVLFDIENKQPVEASDEELMDMYVECFKGVSRKRAR